MQQTNFMCYNTLEVVKMLKINKKKIKEKFRKIKNDYLLVVSFIMSNLINAFIGKFSCKFSKIYLEKTKLLKIQ